MLLLKSFSSGSCGNCYYIGDGKDGIIVDAGISLRRLKKYLMEEGMDFGCFSAVLVTHDHLDHIRHLDSFCKRLGKPVYATSVLHDALARHTFTRDHIASTRVGLPDEGAAQVGPYRVRWFVVPHDATQTVGYQIVTPEGTLVIMTDVGRMTDEAVAYAREADFLVMESNYDMDMLMSGPYPYELKMRICEGCGHLSNDEAASALRRIVHPGLKNVFLCHLSENNNTPSLAFECCSKVLKGTDVCLRCLPRQTPSPLFVLSGEKIALA